MKFEIFFVPTHASWIIFHFVFLGWIFIHHGQNKRYTHKSAQVVTNLQQTYSNAVPTICQQDVFALLVATACWQLATRLLNLTDLFQQDKLFQQLVIVLQFNNLSTSWEWQPCSNLMKQQHCYNLLTSLLQACCEHILLSSCETVFLVKAGNTDETNQWVNLQTIVCFRTNHHSGRREHSASANRRPIESGSPNS
jgi:hypothetical protein